MMAERTPKMWVLTHERKRTNILGRPNGRNLKTSVAERKDTNPNYVDNVGEESYEYGGCPERKSLDFIVPPWLGTPWRKRGRREHDRR